jgi:hypothetical protein
MAIILRLTFTLEYHSSVTFEFNRITSPYIDTASSIIQAPGTFIGVRFRFEVHRHNPQPGECIMLRPLGLISNPTPMVKESEQWPLEDKDETGDPLPAVETIAM